MDFGLGMGAGMWFLWLALIGLVIWVLFMATGRQRPPSDDNSETAMDILKKRLARGEIDEKEYRRLRDELEK